MPMAVELHYPSQVSPVSRSTLLAPLFTSSSNSSASHSQAHVVVVVCTSILLIVWVSFTSCLQSVFTALFILHKRSVFASASTYDP